MAYTNQQEAYDNIGDYILDKLTGGVVTPDQHNLIGWAFDPAVTSGNNTPPAAGVETLIRVVPVRSGLVSNIILQVGAAGVTLISNQNFAGLRTASGLLIAKTADQSGVWNSTGTKTMPVVTPAAVEAGIPYYVAVLCNGTTPPGFQRGVSAAMLNVGLAAGAGRVMTFGTGQTDLAASIAMASAANHVNAIWAGIS